MKSIARLLEEAESLGYRLHGIVREIDERLDDADPTGDEENGAELRQCSEQIHSAVDTLLSMEFDADISAD